MTSITLIWGVLYVGFFIKCPGNSIQGMRVAESALLQCGHKKLYEIQCQKVQGWMISRNFQVRIFLLARQFQVENT